MTEQEWLTCQDYRSMLPAVREACFAGRAGHRKQALFALACCQRACDAPKGNEAAEVLEQFLAGEDSAPNWDHAWSQALNLLRRPMIRLHSTIPEELYSPPELFMGEAIRKAWWRENRAKGSVAANEVCDLEAAHLRELLRDVFANLFCSVRVEPSWLTWNAGTISRLAQSAYDDLRLPEGTLASDGLVILADALEEAGCPDAAILAHCRSAGPHVRGCWVLDLLLGRR
jgi:hypothetical protein